MSFRVKFLQIILSCLLSFFSGVSNSAEQGYDELVGAWEVYKDEELSGKALPKEIMSFWSQGIFRIEGDRDYKGLYRIDGTQMELQLKVGGRSVTTIREFSFRGKDLLFKNPNIGWVYYKKISDKPLGKKPDVD